MANSSKDDPTSVMFLDYRSVNTEPERLKLCLPQPAFPLILRLTGFPILHVVKVAHIRKRDSRFVGDRLPILAYTHALSPNKNLPYVD